MASGLNCNEDVRVFKYYTLSPQFSHSYRRRHVFEMLMALIASPLCDAHACRLALRVLVRAAVLPRVAGRLARQGFGTWLLGCLSTPNTEVVVVSVSSNV